MCNLVFKKNLVGKFDVSQQKENILIYNVAGVFNVEILKASAAVC